jgi:hypothetical protein
MIDVFDLSKAATLNETSNVITPMNGMQIRENLGVIAALLNTCIQATEVHTY